EHWPPLLVVPRCPKLKNITKTQKLGKTRHHRLHLRRPTSLSSWPVRLAQRARVRASVHHPPIHMSLIHPITPILPIQTPPPFPLPNPKSKIISPKSYLLVPPARVSPRAPTPTPFVAPKSSAPMNVPLLAGTILVATGPSTSPNSENVPAALNSPVRIMNPFPHTFGSSTRSRVITQLTSASATFRTANRSSS